MLSGIDGAILYTFYGDSAGDRFGYSVAGAGDVDQDGYGDLIVGAPLDDDNGSYSGSARVLSGIDGAILFTFLGDSAGDEFGGSVDGVGDVNQDGYDDLVVGAPGDDDNGSGCGSARVVSGPTALVPYRRYTFLGDSVGDQFGWSVAGVGDVNQDGFDDLIVGARYDDVTGADSGSASVLSGIDGSLLFIFYGNSSNDRFGYSVDGAGDVNQDGYSDLIVGAPGDDDNGSFSGSARVLSGQGGAILYTFYGDSAGDWFGNSVAGAGDVNQDGYDDLIVGAPGDDDNGLDSGSARVLSGIDGAILHTFYGGSVGDRFGRSVDGAGDVNQNGYSDLIVGADQVGSSSGSARVLSGIDGAILYTFYGDSGGDQFGRSVAGAGDVNQDGYDDLIVGAWADDDNGANSGSARVLSGIDGSILHTFYGDSAGDYFGDSVAVAGDVNRDGYSDLIVGAFADDDNGLSSGSARVFSGQGGAILYTFYGDASDDFLGQSVSGAGDVDQDGYDDLVVGARGDDDNGLNSGSARVFAVRNPVESLGVTCSRPPCTDCPNMFAMTGGGPPVLGNASFALELHNAPGNATYAVLALSLGTCATPGTPGVCTPALLPSPFDVYGYLLTSTVGLCDRVVSIPAGIPNNPTFLGMSAAFQWGVGCSPGRLPLNSQSNCVTLTVVQ